MKKQTITEKYIQKTVEEAKKELAGTTIQNCTFTGAKIELNETAVEVVADITDAIEVNAEACKENAIALKHLTKLFLTSNVKIDALIKITKETKT